MQKIISIMLVLCLACSTILIGIPTSDNISIVNILIAVTAILSIIHNRKRTIKITISDIFLTLLVISSIIPLITKTCISYNSTVNYILRYISIFLIYFTIKQECEQNNKIINYITNTIIISAMFFIICGIDLMSTKYLENLLHIIVGESNISTSEIRMSSIFMYANAFAAFIGMAIFLILGKLKAQNKTNLCFSTILMWCFVGIIASESRLLLGCLAIVLLLYLILNKNQVHNILKFIIMNGIIAIVVTSILFKLISLGMFWQIWLMCAVFTLVTIGINYFINKIELQNKKINIKTIIFILMFIIIIIVGLLNIKEELILFKGDKATNLVRKQIGSVSANKQYTFEIDLEAKSDIPDNFKIIIIEKNKFLDEIKENSIVFDNYTGTKKINVNLAEDTTNLSIYFKSKQNTDNTELKIKSLLVNGKEIIIHYKFLPDELVKKLLNLGSNMSNLYERLEFGRNAIVAAIDNHLLGVGGGGWKYIHRAYSNYDSPANEVHSYIAQIIVEFGIIGIIAYIGLITTLIKNCIKNINKNNEIICAVLLIILHSILDFEMSYFLIMLVTYSLIAILTNQSEEKSVLQISNKFYIPIAILIITSINLINANAAFSKYYVQEEIKNTKSYYTKLELQELNVKLNPYNLEYQKTQALTWQIYRTSIDNIKKEDNIRFIKKINDNIETIFKKEIHYYDIELLNILTSNTIQLLKYDEKEIARKYINLLWELNQEIGSNSKYQANMILKQMEQLKELIIQLQKSNYVEFINGYEELANQKYQLIMEQVQDYTKCRITQNESAMYIETINDMISEINQVEKIWKGESYER